MMSKTLILAPVMAVALTACNKNEDAAAPAGDGARRTGAGQLGRRHDAVVLIPGPAGRPPCRPARRRDARPRAGMLMASGNGGHFHCAKPPADLARLPANSHTTISPPPPPPPDLIF
ncbi:Uncharacterised protein [Bordetella pertussis]|nr:Uncharacterised protein [Bordetella pertussis]CPL99646.1 Uncharacterised protein [Bordetella pertussis]CPP64097.1 Uncharacterised protein [Bordetella pertussis]